MMLEKGLIPGVTTHGAQGQTRLFGDLSVGQAAVLQVTNGGATRLGDIEALAAEVLRDRRDGDRSQALPQRVFAADVPGRRDVNIPSAETERQLYRRLAPGDLGDLREHAGELREPAHRSPPPRKRSSPISGIVSSVGCVHPMQPLQKRHIRFVSP